MHILKKVLIFEKNLNKKFEKNLNFGYVTININLWLEEPG
jgi:hypothetical protein